MNRQTILVTVATLALVVLGAILLYTGSGPGSGEGAAPGPKAAKVEKAGKAKGAKGGKSPVPNRVPPARLVHAREVSADRPAAPAGAPNVVLVVMSTQRRDQWSVYGGPEGTTPFLGEKAARGVKMNDALSVAVDPKASSAAIVTGRYPHEVGALQLGEKRNNRPIAPEAETLAERFSQAGWFTVGLTANHVLNQKFGGSQGFDWYRDAQQFSLMTELRIDAPELVTAALERVSARTDAEKARPLYLRLALVDSHKPIKMPPEEFAEFGGDDGEVAPYRASIKRQDAALAELARGLAAQGITDDNTIFVVVADHGEGLDMPPAHRKQHGFVLYGSSVQIPWIWWGKGVPAGKSVDGLASQLDLAPTLVALAGLGGQQGFDGVDLSAAVLGKGPSPRTEAYADTTYEGVHRASLWTATAQCQKDYGSKSLEGDVFVTGCFDREADPDFTKPVDDAALMARLDQQHGQLIAKVPAPGGPAGGAPEAEPEAEQPGAGQ